MFVKHVTGTPTVAPSQVRELKPVNITKPLTDFGRTFTGA